MAQYKAAMQRIANEKGEGEGVLPKDESLAVLSPGVPMLFRGPHVATYAQNALYTLPVVWCILFLLNMDRASTLELWFMPFIGILAACLANSVPVGGGIVFVPALILLGAKVKLGVAFTVATMTFGNGVFGFLNWLRKDPEVFVWGSFKYTVPSAWFGAVIGTFHPLLSESHCKLLFALFSSGVAVLVLRAARNGGKIEPLAAAAAGRPEEELLAEPATRLKLAAVGFSAGLVLVANIAIGNAMATFLSLTLVLGVETRRAIVTGIVAGGWTSLVPFLLHLMALGDVPVARWLMVLPGVFLGARLAPHVHARLGLERVLWAFGAFLLATAGLMYATS